MTFEIEIYQFYDYLKPNNGNETKPDIFSWDIFKSDIIFHLHRAPILTHSRDNCTLRIWLLTLGNSYSSNTKK